MKMRGEDELRTEEWGAQHGRSTNGSLAPKRPIRVKIEGSDHDEPAYSVGLSQCSKKKGLTTPSMRRAPCEFRRVAVDVAHCGDGDNEENAKARVSSWKEVDHDV